MRYLIRFVFAAISASLPASGCIARVTDDSFALPSEPAVNLADPAHTGVGFPEFPSLSPDGSILVYAWAGDLWATTTSGGASSRLTVHPGDDRRSSFSPDGKWLAFDSDRDGARNIYIMPIFKTPAGVIAGECSRVTMSDRPQSVSGWSADGKEVFFTAVIEPSLYRSFRMYRVGVSPQVTSQTALIGGPVRTITSAYGVLPRMAGDSGSIVFGARTSPSDRPRYRGSGTAELWRLSTSDGSVKRITSPGASDFDPWPLPDGSVVFLSSRDGQNNLWKVGPGGEAAGAPVQLTRFKPSADSVTIGHGARDLAVSADGRVAAFVVWDRVYTLDLSGGQNPQPLTLQAAGDSTAVDVQRVSADRDASELALSPDGKTLALVSRGDVWVRNTTEGYPTRRVTATDGRERDLAWSPDGRVLYFSSDEGATAGKVDGNGKFDRGRYAIYGATVAIAREDLDPDKKKDEAKDDKKEEGKKDAASEKKDDKPAPEGGEEKDKKDAGAADSKSDESKKKPKEKKPDFGKRWSEALRFNVDMVASAEGDIRHPIPSPDGRMLAFTRGLGDLVLLNLETKAERVLFSSWSETEMLWTGDSRHLVYAIEDLDFNSDIWLLDTGGADAAPDFKAAPINLTQHPDNDIQPRLSADGKVLTFLSERGTQSDQFDVYQVYLDKELEGLTAYDRDDYFKKAGEAAGKRKPIETPAFALPKPAPHEETRAAADDKSKDAPVGDAKAEGAKPDEAKPAKPKKPEPLKFDAADAYLRVRRITSSAGAKSNLAVTPGADRIMFVAPGDTESALVSIDHKGGDRKVLQSGGVGETSVSLTGDKVLFVRQGVANSTAPKGGGKVDTYPLDAPMVVDVAKQQRQKFLEAARTFGDRFYHPTMKGVNWNGCTLRYLQLAEQTRTGASFNRVVEMLFGEIDGSHTGASGGASYSSASLATGYLGIRHEPVAGGYRVTRVMRDGPAWQKQSRLNEGDIIVAVEGRQLSVDDTSLPTVDLDAAMAGRAGRETLIEVKRNANPPPVATDATDGDAEKKPVTPKPLIVATPIAWGAWDAIAYADKVQERRDKVEQLSGGRLGYLHIRAMGEASVREFERDLYAAAHGKDGLVIDVRDNGGGSTADILLSSLTAPRHAKTQPRGVDPKDVPADAYPRDRRLIYAWTRPINVLINQNSFSNAEIFAHAIKTIGRGRLVGMATFGGVISTGAFTLIDGTTIRMPFRGWYLPDGRDLENNGAQPDVNIPQTPEDEAAGRDPQLEAAVKDLLATLSTTPK